MYDVRYDPKAEEQLEKLAKEITQRIIKKLAYVGETGRGIEPLKDNMYGYKIRIGDYRALIDLIYSTKPPTIFVRYIDHRKRVYKNL
ncbi:MAG: type II toxin-antitoxin system RelE/ParE family toxin [Nanoarchaeota archaeon]